MKRFLTITVIALSLLVFTACGGSKKNKDNTDTVDTDTDVVDTDTTDTTDTTPSGDTDSDTDADTDPTNPTNPTDPTNPTTDPTTEPDDGCTGISIDWSTFNYYYEAVADFGDEELPDYFWMEFYDENGDPVYMPEKGTYDLGSGRNTNYATCNECVRIYQDLITPEDEEEDSHPTKEFFQKSGTLTIEATDDNYNIKGTIKATLVEVTINTDTYESTPVANGACIKIETSNFDSGVEEECVPECGENWECGNDGCGGTCGAGCDGQACSADHKCVDFECTKLTLGEAFLNSSSTIAPVEGNKAGSTTLEDYLVLGFYAYPELGTFDLDLSYSDCDYCMMLYEDVDSDGYATKLYFQESGELTFTEVYDESFETKGKASFRLVEIDEEYAPVDGGSCYEVENFTWDTVCVPQCEGKICGSDGCGGVCGNCGDKACSEDQTECVDMDLSECTGLSIDITTLTQYKTNIFIAASNEDYDPIFQMQFYQNLSTGAVTAGTYDLGSETNINYANCTECIMILSDVVEDEYTKILFQHEGTLTVTDVNDSNQVKGTIQAKIAEVTVSGYETTFVPGGECVEIEAGTAFNAQGE